MEGHIAGQQSISQKIIFTFFCKSDCIHGHGKSNRYHLFKTSGMSLIWSLTKFLPLKEIGHWGMDYYMDEELAGWLHLKSQWNSTQRINGFTLLWKPVTSGAPQESKMRPTLLNIFVNDTGNGTDCNLCKSADDTKLCSATDSLKGIGHIEMDFDSLRSGPMWNTWGSTRPNAMSGTWAVAIPRLGDKGLGNSPAKNSGLGGARRQIIGSLHLQPRMPTVSWAASIEFGQQVKGIDSVPLLPSTSWDAYWGTMPCSGVHSARRTLTC